MKIALVTRFYPPDTGGGGIATYAYNLANGLQNAGHQIRVISAMAQGSQKRQTISEVDVFRIAPILSSYRWTRLPIIGRQVRLIRDLFYSLRVRRVFADNRTDYHPDIVEYADIDAEGFFHPISLSPYVVKLLASHTILRPYYSPKEVSYARAGIEWMEAKAIRQAQGLSSPSLYSADDVAHKLRVDRQKITHVPNFIDVNTIRTSEIDNDIIPTILFVGRLEPLKGAPVFAQAIPLIAQKYPKIQFIFVGPDRLGKDGKSQKKALEQFFLKEGVFDKVLFSGFVSSEALQTFYQRATLFVMPSLFETFGYTLLEAMACGKACVVSRAGGMTEMLVNGESGLFFEAGNSEDLAEKVIALLQNSSLRRSMGQAARQRVEHEYSLDVGVEKTVTFYRNVLSGNG